MEEEDKDGPSDSQRLLENSSSSHYQSLSPRAGPMGNQADSPNMPPRDRFLVVYFIFYILGLGTLLPWNFFITANGYWMFKLNSTSPPRANRSVSTESPNSTWIPTDTQHQAERNTLQNNFQNTLSVCAMVPNVIFQFLNTLLQQRVSEKARMLVSVFIMIFIFIVTEALVKVDVTSWQEGFFALTMVSVVILNICSAIFQSSLFGMASNLPSLYIQALMAGQGMGGLFAASALIVSLALSSGEVASAFAYFLTAIVVLLITVACYILLLKNHFYRYNSVRVVISQVTNTEKVPRLDSRSSEEVEVKRNGDAWIRTDPYTDMKETDLFNDNVEYEQTSNVPPLLAIFKKIWPHYVSVAFIFFITLACYPAITSKVISLSKAGPWSNKYFTPVSCFLLFNLTDWLGRSLAGIFRFPSEENWVALLLASFARGVFPALFALCNAHPRTTPVLFNHDGYFIGFMVLFGLSNGYLGTLAMQYGPKRVDARHAATSGSMLAFAISIGLAAGAAFSFVVQAAM